LWIIESWVRGRFYMDKAAVFADLAFPELIGASVGVLLMENS
jgi:hypothetical protein